MAGLALRRNPRRAHLLVSRLLGKHLPVDPRLALAAGAALAERLPADVAAAGPLVFGFAETATALGHSVAAAIPGADYVSSTRRPGEVVTTFDEEHSHAVGHRILADPALVAAERPVLLVDDELSTGRTAVNTIRALHALAPRPSYTVAALLDLRPGGVRGSFDDLSAELGVPVRAAALLSGKLHVPADAAARAAPLVAAGDRPLAPGAGHALETLDPAWPAELPLSGRYGWQAEWEQTLATALKPLVESVLDRLAALVPRRTAARRRFLVLGTEELMYVPMRLAAALADEFGESADVLNQSTTRSPVVPIDRDGYAVRCALSFPAPDEPERASYVYNVAPEGYDAIVVVGDPPVGIAPRPMLTALAGCAPVLFVRLPEATP
jgi:adenine/guanine phosphoribosyltransferase-like PRPP-binding protein